MYGVYGVQSGSGSGSTNSIDFVGIILGSTYKLFWNQTGYARVRHSHNHNWKISFRCFMVSSGPVTACPIVLGSEYIS